MKMYLVINDWSNESACQVDMIDYKLFKDYENAKKYYEEQKEKIISFDLDYNEVEEKEDYYCIFENGEYLYNHELVYIKEMEVN